MRQRFSIALHYLRWFPKGRDLKNPCNNIKYAKFHMIGQIIGMGYSKATFYNFFF